MIIVLEERTNDHKPIKNFKANKDVDYGWEHNPLRHAEPVHELSVEKAPQGIRRGSALSVILIRWPHQETSPSYFRCRQKGHYKRACTKPNNKLAYGGKKGKEPHTGAGETRESC